jgi:NAD(P)-dependent dehydrogenase (short-subunit alcohol dehydrogenase family)
MEDFKDRVAIVTGSAQSIGFTIAETLADAGCIVVLADIRRDRLQEARAKLTTIALQ